MTREKIYLLTSLFWLTMAVGLLGLGLWAYESQIEESVTGLGQIIPEGKLRRIMSPTGGVVAEVLVSENQQVENGELLLELDPEPADLQNENLAEQLKYTQNEIEALRAAIYQEASAPQTDRLHSEWLAATNFNYQAQLDSAQAQIQTAEHQYAQTQKELARVKDLLSLKRSTLARYRSLYEEGGLTQNELAAYEEGTKDLQGREAALEEEVKARQSSLEQARQRLTEVQAAHQKELLNQLTTHQRTLLELEGKVAQSEVHLEYQQIHSPIRGTVNELVIRGSGEVVNAGQLLMTVVPSDSELLAEVRVSNQDLSYIRVGQPVALRIDAFPYQQFGRLDGVVRGISPFTVQAQQPENNQPPTQPLFAVKIELAAQGFQHNDIFHPLRPGMTLSADIITRQKRIIDFLIEPLEYSWRQAFHDPSSKF